ncbi:hypothetical protein D3C73_1000510 [compost metagenome]
MVVGAGAGGAHGDLARVLLCVSRQVGQRLQFVVVAHGERARIVNQIAQQVIALPGEGGLALDGNGQQIGRVDEADGVAVGLRAGQFRETDGAARAGAVQHHDAGVVTQVFLQERRHHARHQIGAAARAVRHDQVDGVFGVAGRLRAAGEQGGAGQQGDGRGQRAQGAALDGGVLHVVSSWDGSAASCRTVCSVAARGRRRVTAIWRGGLA